MKRVRWMALLLGMLLVGACSAPELETKPAAEQAVMKKVKTGSAVSAVMGVPVKVEASVTSSSRIEIFTEVSGKIAAKHVEVGTKVKSGQVLFELDQSDLKLLLRRAKLVKEKVTIEMENAKEQFRENENNIKDLMGISMKEADLAIEEASRNLSKSTIISPIAGVVVDIAGLTAGQQVNPSMKLVQIEQMDPLHIEATVKEKDLLEIEGKESLKLYLPVLDQTVDAKIVYISPSNAGGQQGGFIVKAQIANSENVFRPGMSAQLILDDSMAQQSAAVPIASVLKDGDNHYVYTLSNDRAVRTQVEVGRKNKDLIEITAGLKEGDSIIIVGQSLLSDGDIVEIVD